MSLVQIGFATGELAELDVPLVIYAATDDEFEKGKPKSAALKKLDHLLGGVLGQAASDVEFDAKGGSELVLHTHGKTKAARIAILGLGKKAKVDRDAARLAASRAVKVAERLKAPRAAFAFHFGKDEALVEAAAEGAQLGAYRFDKYLSDKKPRRLAKLDLVVGETIKKQKEAAALGTDIGAAVNLARDLVNEPASVITPTTLAQRAVKLAKDAGLQIEVLERKEIAKLKMGMFLGVAQGSAEAPKLIHLWWEPKGKKKEKPVALVGKSITFDSGGLSIKPASGMETMKCDMAGSAAVLAAMSLVPQIAPSFPVHAFIGSCENMPSGTAQRPGDIVTARNGKTVEVLNTDAEGRLVLGDVLSWATEFEPSAIIDLATLTGAIVVALGPWTTGLFSSDDTLAKDLLKAADGAGEDVWRMPMQGELKELIKSPIADLKNTGGRNGGSITAALFLKEFVGDVPWAHLDIAGPAFGEKEKGYDPRGGTGTGVRLLAEYLRRRA